MTIEFVLLSGVRIGKYYKIEKFYEDVHYFDLMMGVMDENKIHETKTFGKLLEIRQHGRQSVSDVLLIFEDATGNKIEYKPLFGCVEEFVEFELLK